VPKSHTRPRSARFERLEHRELRRVLDTKTLREGDDVPGVGYADGSGALVTYHVTDNPEAVSALVARKGRLMAAYGEKGKWSELGPGLYVSGNPHFWVGRARGKWDFLKRLTPTQTAALLTRLRSDLEEMHKRRWLSANEYSNAVRDLGLVDQGHYEPTVLTMMAGQPYNIKLWEPSYLAPLGIEPGRKPRVLEVRIVGKFAELGGSHPDVTLLRTLRRGGVAGAYTRAGMATNPELVIWDPKAVVSVREVDLDR
jgi:hypothetical protein